MYWVNKCRSLVYRSIRFKLVLVAVTFLLLWSLAATVFSQSSAGATVPCRSGSCSEVARLACAIAVDRNQALAKLEKVAREQPDTPAAAMAQVEIGLILLGRGQLDQAQDTFEKLVLGSAASDPFIEFQQMRAQFSIGTLHHRRGQLERARQAWQKVLTDYRDPGLKLSDGSTPAEMADFQIGASLLQEDNLSEGIAYLQDFIARRRNCYLANRAIEILGKYGINASGTAAGKVSPKHTASSASYGDHINGDVSEGMCGPLCLTRALESFGISTDARAIAAQAGTRKDGTTLWQLKETAEEKGIVAEGKYVADRDLHKLALPAILWVKRNHYVLVEAVAKKWWFGPRYYDPFARSWHRSHVAVRVYDPSLAGPSGYAHGERTLAVEELRSPWGYGWDGYCLVLGKKESARAGAAIVGFNLPGGWSPDGRLLALLAILGSWLLWARYPRTIHALAATFYLRPAARARRPRQAIALALCICVAVTSFGFERYVLAAPPSATLRAADSVRPLNPVEMYQIIGGRCGEGGPSACWEGSDRRGGCGGCRGSGPGRYPTYNVNTNTGNLQDPQTLLAAYGSMPPEVLLNVQLMRDSKGTPGNFSDLTSIGGDWLLNYSMELADNGTSEIYLRMPDALVLTFTQVGSTYISPAGYAKLQLERITGVEWRLTRKSALGIPELIYHFPPTNPGAQVYNAPLQRIEDANGNSLTIARLPNKKIDRITDASGHQATFVYDVTGSLVRIDAADGRSVRFAFSTTYDTGTMRQTEDLRVTDAGSGLWDYVHIIQDGLNPYLVRHTITDPLLLTRTFDYDTSGRIVQISAPGRVRQYSYQDNGDGTRTTTITDEEGHWTRHIHDANGNLIREERQVNGSQTIVTQNVYDGDHNWTSWTDPRGNTWDFTYDALGNLLTVTKPSVGGGPRTQISYTYDAVNRRTTYTNELGKVWTREYDTRSNLVSDQDPVQAAQSPPVKTIYAYDAQGRRVSVTNALGKVTTYDYDSSNNLISVTDPLGNSVRYAFDGFGRQLSMILPEPAPSGASFFFTLDNLDRVTRVTNPDSTFRTTTYNCCNKVSETDENGKLTQYEYNVFQELIRSWPADDPGRTGAPIQQDYYGTGDLRSITDRRGNRTTYFYDGIARLIKTQQTDSQSTILSTEEYTYDDADNFTSKKKPDGNIISFAYDELNRMKTVHYPAGQPDVNLVYDDASRQTRMTDGTGTYDFAYDDRGDLTSKTYPAIGPNPRRVLNYAYDVARQRTSMAFTGYGATTYLYNDGGFVSSVTTPDGNSTSYAYNRNNAIGQTTLPNSSKAVYAYSSRGFLTRLQNLKSDNSRISEFVYTLDAVSNRLRMEEPGTGTYTSWFYDDLYQLTRETKRNSVDSTAITDVSYTYDPAGNRLTQRDNITSMTINYTYNNRNQLLTAGTTSFTYDANGNPISTVVGGQTTTYSWDYDDRLAQITYPSALTNTFVTATGGKRRKKIDSSATRNYFYDGDNLIAESDAGDNLVATYDHGPTGLVSQNRSGGRNYYHFDGLGATRQLTNPGQVVTDSYAYDAWGNSMAGSGTTVNPLQYAGRYGYYKDSDSGLMLLGQRYYNSQIGRFATTDPIGFDGGSLNTYTYVRNSPVNFVDPSGLVGPAALLAVCAVPCGFMAACLIANWLDCWRGCQYREVWTEGQIGFGGSPRCYRAIPNNFINRLVCTLNCIIDRCCSGSFTRWVCRGCIVCLIAALGLWAFGASIGTVGGKLVVGLAGA